MTEHDTRLCRLLDQLRQISPMPPELQATHEGLVAYEAILDQLESCRDPKCIVPLINSLAPDTTFGLVWGVVHMLERFPSELLNPHLREALRTGEVGARAWAANMLGRSRDSESLTDLLAATKDPETRVRAEVAQALGMIGDPVALPALEILARDPDREVQSAAEYALQDFT